MEDARKEASIVTSGHCFACIGSGSDFAEAHTVRLWPAAADRPEGKGLVKACHHGN